MGETKDGAGAQAGAGYTRETTIGEDVREIFEYIGALQESNAEMLAALKGLDDHWTEDMPGGPDGLREKMRLTDETLKVWRDARTAIANAERAEREGK